MGLRRRHLRELRRARRQARQQQRALLTLEVAGLVAVTLHSATHALTLPVGPAMSAQLVGEFTELLHARRQHLQAEVRRLRADWPPAGPTPPPARPGHPAPTPPAAPES